MPSRAGSDGLDEAALVTEAAPRPSEGVTSAMTLRRGSPGGAAGLGLDVTRVASGGLEVLDLQLVASGRGQAVVLLLQPEDEGLQVARPAGGAGVLDGQDRGGPYVAVQMTRSAPWP